MTQRRIRIAANTWTNVAAITAEVGQQVVFTAGTAMQVGRRATAPTSGVAVPRGVGAVLDIKQGDPLVPWVFMAAGGILNIESTGGRILIVDGTGTA